MRYETTIVGSDKIKVVMQRFTDGLDKHVAANLEYVADRVKGDAQEMCPVDTGSLQRSIRKEVISKPSQKIWQISVRAGGYVTNPKTRRKVDYAAYVEYGTSTNRPQPFLQPALMQNKEAIHAAVAQAVIDDIMEAEK